jgi:hypothetical protein
MPGIMTQVAVLRIVTLLMTVSVLAGPFSATSRAQQGKDIAGGLLKALIESQLEKSRRRGGGSGNLRDPFGTPNGQHGRPQPLTPQMQRLRPITASFAQETAVLGALLQTDARRSVEVRRQLPEVIRLQASATALNQRSAAENNHAVLLEDFRTLNGNWSTLSHQLTHCKSLSSQTTACVKRLAALDAQYCSLLDIQEQFNDQELVRAAYTLTTYMRDVVDDVRVQPLPRNTSARLMSSLGQLSQKTEYFAGLVSRGSRFQTVVNEYQELYQAWIAVEPSLSGLNDHSIGRSLRRIRDSHQAIHQLLRIEMGIDKAHVLNLAHEVEHYTTELFRVVTLEQLMALPDGGAVPDAADALMGTIQNVDDHIHRDETPQAIGEAWVYADEAWNQFSYYVSPIRTGAVPQELQAIGASMHSLQQALGVTVQYDRNSLVRNASSLENLAERLVATLRQWQTHPGQHDRTLVEKAEKMVEEFHHIEQALAAGDQPGHHLSDCDAAIALWQQIRPVLKACDTDEREQFDHIVATLTPEIVRLRTMLDE